MIKTRDIYDSINRALALQYKEPKIVIYTQYIPKDFNRPSFLIEHIRTTPIDINRNTVQKTSYFTITAFLPVDKYNRSKGVDLIDRQDEILNTFSMGYITVGNRNIKLKSSSGGTDLDAVYIDLQFEYFDNRTEEVEELPTIQTVITNFKEV